MIRVAGLPLRERKHLYWRFFLLRAATDEATAQVAMLKAALTMGGRP